MTQFKHMNNEVKIWCHFGTGENQKIMNIHSAYARLGEEICLALPFFHAFSGCDSTTSFFKIPKKRWFEIWMSSPMRDDVTTTFQQLSWLPNENSVAQGIQTIARFVTYAYIKTETNLNSARLNIYTSSVKGDLRALPPSADALNLHVRRCCYQAGWIWGNTLSQQEHMAPEHWGWHIYQDRLFITWATTVELGTKHLSVIIRTCNCIKAKCNSCRCANMGCLNFCSCRRKCTINN